MTSESASKQSPHAVLRRLVDEASMIVWEADNDGRCIYLNPEAMSGLAAAQDVHISDWFAFIHPDDFSHAAELARAAKLARREYKIEYRLMRSDGSLRWMMGTGTPRFDAGGRLCGYLGTVVDITESHEAAARLARSEAEHRLLTESARELISHSDANHRYVYASPSHKETLGYDPNELIGTPLYDYIHPDDLRPVKSSKRRGLTNIRFRHKNGAWIWLSANTRTIHDPRTNEKLGIVSVARDITAQLEAERELVRSEARFRSLTSLSSDWYWETDADIRFTFFSEGMYSRLGIDPKDLLGSTFASHVKDPRSPGFVTCMESIAGRRPFRDVIYPAELTSFPGVVRYLRISGEPVVEDNVFLGYRGVTRDVTREVKTAHALERLATYDTLTGLPNRAMLEQQLKQKIGDRSAAALQAVLFIDLDDFKQVNDSLGHAAGDVLLRAIALRLRECVRPEDMVARLGGDEFVVVADCAHDIASAEAIAEKLCIALDAPVVISGHEVKAGASIGISMYPQDGDSSEALLQNADTALYRAKAAGGRTWRFFTPDMGTESKTRLLMQAALRHALERNEFEVHYQPRVNLKTMAMTGMEALLRWTHPEMGAIPPARFIPLAEESGLIDDIGDWVLQQATAQAREWVMRYNVPLRISVNLSARQLRSDRLLSSVADALGASGLPAHLLELELTESGLMEDPELAARLLQQLRSLGLSLSVDDFGTGYSSLAYLCRFPLDKLKLDRSFLLQKHTELVSPWKLAEAIINLAHTLNLAVVAEGVETQEHLDFLRNTSCDEIQGFCISKPLPAHEFENLLRKGVASLPVRYPRPSQRRRI
jgi:diguanylate cyclase (GGDEF)-like protein/PAS domain S-box-containing protein